MKAETLKKIAECMYPNENIDIEDDEVWIMNYPSTAPGGRGYKILGTQFNPIADNNQMVEIMEKLIHLHNLEIKGGFACTDTIISNRNNIQIAYGKTLPEAVVIAASELVKDK